MSIIFERRELFLGKLGTFEVPQYISGNWNEDKKSGFWLVRRSKQNVRRYFCFCNKREALTLLIVAENYLNSVYKVLSVKIPDQESNSKKQKTGTRGIQIRKSVRNGRKIEEISFIVDRSLIGLTNKVIYVGTLNTITKEKFLAKLREAKDLRKNVVQKAKINRDIFVVV